MIRAIAGLGVVWCVSLPTAALAGAVFDGTLGPVGALSGNFEIPAADGRQVGANLFHSFETFNVDPGESATFTSNFAGVTRNVIARVTGAGISTIDGPLSSTIPGASLWIINPNGLAFGADARIDVQGGFHASTADYLVLEDGGRFDATAVGNTVLTMANPAAFGFLDADIGPISVGAATLAVPEGETLSLVGGDIELDGATLTAAGGQINLASARAAGVLDLNDRAANLSAADALGDIRLDSATVSADGERGGGIYILAGEFVARSTEVTSRTMGSMDGRGIRIDVGDLSLGDSTDIETDAFGAGAAGPIEIRASGTVSLAPADTPDGAAIQSIAEDGSTGAAGGIAIAAGDFDMRLSAVVVGTAGAGTGGPLDVEVERSLYVEGGFGSALANNSTGAADAGDVRIRAGDVHFVGGSVLARALGDGNGGNVMLSADNLTMENGAQFVVGATGLGDGGAIRIDVGDTVTLTDNIGYPTGIFAGAAEGRGGDVRLTSRVLNILNGAQVSSAAAGAGRAGNIDVDAGDTVTLSGAPGVDTGIFANTFAAGDAGNITIRAPDIEIDSGAYASSGTFGTGHGGNVVVDAGERLQIKGLAPQYTGIFANTFWDGDAGSIAVSAPKITVTDGGFIQSASFSADPLRTGAGGNIVVDTQDLTVDGGFISARTETSGDGGSVTVNASGTVSLLDSSGLAFSNQPIGGLLVSAGGITNSPIATGSAGDITVNAGTLRVRDGGVISGDTFLSGDAGNITVNADVIDLFAETSPYTGLFDSSGSAGHGGAVTLHAQGISIGGHASILAGAFGAGDAGAIDIDTQDLSMSAGGSIASATYASGAGGSISVVADMIELTESALINAGTTAEGRGGDVAVTAGSISLSSGAGISARGTAAGDAGTVAIRAADRLDLRGGTIETSSTQSSGGNIDIGVGGMLFMDGGLISAAAGGVTPQDAGGNVDVDPQFVVLRDSKVLASANAGNGGNIGIRAGTFVIDAGSRIDASSMTGLDGHVLIDSPHQITGAVDLLATPATAVSAFVADRCAPRLPSERSTLVADGASGVPAAPTDYLASPLEPVDAKVAAAEYSSLGLRAAAASDCPRRAP